MPNDRATLDLAELEAAAALARPYVPGSVAAACERAGYPRHGIMRPEARAAEETKRVRRMDLAWRAACTAETPEGADALFAAYLAIREGKAVAL